MFIVGVEGNHKTRLPWVTWSLIAVNLLVFGIQVRVGDPMNYGFSLIPAEISHGKDLVKPQKVKIKVPVETHPRARARGRRQAPVRYKEESVYIPQYPGPIPIQLTLITSMFMHGGWLHLIGNMWFLFVFGGQVENALRSGLFLVFYLFCGVAGGVAHVLVDPESVIPCMGASGAISGVMGAYLRIYPFSKVKIWFGWAMGIVEVPAVVVLGVWFVLQYLSGEAAITSGEVHGGVAYWAHIGGFLAGVVFIVLLVLYLRAEAAERAKEAAAARAAADAEAANGSAATPAQVAGQAGLSQQAAGPEQALKPDPFANFLPESRRKVASEEQWR